MKHCSIHILIRAIAVSLLFHAAASFAGESVNITVGSRTRHMLVHAPSGIATARPLMIAMHGRGLTAASHETESKLNPIADTERFVVVYPTGIDNTWDISGTMDIDFIVAIINYTANRFGTDRNRVYLSGFSMGGMMTYYAATKIADRIAAFAPISGYLLSGPNTNSSRPIPLIHTHGRNDNVISYSGVQGCIDAWVRRNGCPTTPQITDPYPSSKPSSYCAKYYYGPGSANVSVVLLALRDKGHWIATDSDKGINTSLEIWNFCKNYSLVGTGVVLYRDYNYSGPAGQALPVGNYTAAQLAARGIPDNWASSARIPAGRTLIMYQNDNFTGTSWTRTSDTSSFGSLSPSANDQVSSVRVQ